MYKPEEEEIVQAAPEVEAAPEANEADIPVDTPPEEADEVPVEDDNA